MKKLLIILAILAMFGCDWDDDDDDKYYKVKEGETVVIIGSNQPLSTPEPATIFLLGTGLVLIGNKIRKK